MMTKIKRDWYFSTEKIWKQKLKSVILQLKWDIASMI